jgi:hypothetical protein
LENSSSPRSHGLKTGPTRLPIRGQRRTFRSGTQWGCISSRHPVRRSTGSRHSGWRQNRSEEREDHNGRGPLGPTCGHYFGLPVSPATTLQHHFSAGAGVQGSARFPGTGAGGILSFPLLYLACGKPSVVAWKPLLWTLRLASLAYPLAHLVLQVRSRPNPRPNTAGCSGRPSVPQGSLSVCCCGQGRPCSTSTLPP